MPCIPPDTAVLLTIMGSGQGLGKREFPSLLSEAHAPQSPSTSMARREGEGAKGWAPPVPCALHSPLCPCLHGNGRRREDHTHNERLGKPLPAHT